MPNLLHLDSSADLVSSRSRAITRTFASEWRAQAPGNTVTYRDLHRDPLPHLPDTALHWPEHLRQGQKPPAPAEELQQELFAELMAADVLLIGAPMYNYSLPSTLKAWVDYIHVPGVTAAFGDYQPPLVGRPAVIVTSRGGAYDAGTPTADWDHGVPVLQIILAEALGMTVSVIATSLTLAKTLESGADDISRSRRELAQAHEKARALAGELSLH